MRKLELMHKIFGVTPGKQCKTCTNFIRFKYHDYKYSKCTVYGNTQSEASDWSGRNTACGQYNKRWDGLDIIRNVTKSKDDPEPVMEGQITLFEA